MYAAAKEYFQILQQVEGASPEKREQLKSKQDKLSAPFSDNVSYHAFLEVKRLAAVVDDSDQMEKE